MPLEKQQTSPSPEAVVGMLGRMLGADLIAALQEAFLTGNFDGVVHVLGTSTNAQVRAGKQAVFHVACAAGDAAAVGLALACGGVNASAAPDPGQPSVLWRAVGQGQVDVVRVLVESGQVDVNHPGPSGETALWRAASAGDAACTCLLLAAEGVDVNRANDVGATALYVACQVGQEACARLLLAAADTDQNQATDDGATPLHIACEKGHEACVLQLLAAAGTDQNLATNTGATPLFMACQMGHEACVRLLLATAGTSVNAPRNGGITPLHKACNMEGNAALATLVLVGGGDRFAKTTNHGGITPLELTTSKTIRELFRLGIDYWQRRRHARHSHAMRQAVLALLLARQRLGARALPAPALAAAHGRATRASRRQPPQQPTASLVHLPEEIWLLVCTFLRSADFEP